MFWKYNNINASQIETVLEKENVTLSEILDHEGVIQECKNQTTKLIDFLTKPEILSELISLIISEPPQDVDEIERFKLPHVAAEILSCEIQQISQSIAQDEQSLEKLFSFMELEAPLNPLLASFFSKAVAMLLTRKPEQNWYEHQYGCVQVIDYLKKKEFVNLALKHIGTSAITDLVLRLITCMDNGEIRTGVLEWLNDRELIQSIIKLIDVQQDRDTHDNAARLVIEILRVCRDSQYAPVSDRFDDPLLNTLEAADTVDLILKIIFGKVNDPSKEAIEDRDDVNLTPPPDSVITNGISILLALLETRTAVINFNANPAQDTFAGNFNSQNTSSELSPEDAAKQEATLKAILTAIHPWITQFTDLLICPPKLATMNTTAGVLDPPLGQTRLNVAKLIAVLLSTNDLDINQKLKECNTVNILLDLFFKYSLNNFLHAQVEECIRLVFAWNNALISNPDEEIEPTSPTGVRLKTPPTVEMIEHEEEEAAAATAAEETKEEKSETETKTETPQENVETDQKVEVKEESDEAPSKPASVAINTYENPLLADLYTSCRIVDRVLEAWDENENEETRPGFHRKGYMGHLTRIANMMHQNMSNKSKCQSLIEEYFSQYPQETKDNWEKFVTGRLAETNERNKIIPPAQYANKHSSSDDEDSDFKDIAFPQESSSAQLFSDYQMQQMSENFIDTFGFSEAAFTEDTSEDNGKDEMHRLTNVLSEGSDDTNSADVSKRAQGIFEAICEQRFTSFPGGFDDDLDENEMKEAEEDDDEDPWADKTKEIRFSNSPQGKVDKNSTSSPTANSSDEEDQGANNSTSPKKENSMEIDDDDEEWATLNHRENSTEVIESGSGVATEVAMDMGNPWDSKPLAASTTVPFDNPFESSSPGPKSAEGWANFSAKDGDSEMSPVKNSGSGEFGAFVGATNDNVETTEKSPVTSPQKSPTEEKASSDTNVPMQ